MTPALTRQANERSRKATPARAREPAVAPQIRAAQRERARAARAAGGYPPPPGGYPPPGRRPPPPGGEAPNFGAFLGGVAAGALIGGAFRR
jgi:hypothetical protein